MKLKAKLGLFALSAGLVAFGTGACLFRWLGDMIGDSLWLRGID